MEREAHADASTQGLPVLDEMSRELFPGFKWLICQVSRPSGYNDRIRTALRVLSVAPGCETTA